MIISADQMKEELFYVAASRGREGLTVITVDKERLRDSVAQSDSRQSATELVRKSGANVIKQPAHSIRQKFASEETRKAQLTQESQHRVAPQSLSPSHRVGITKSLGPFAGLTGTYIPGDVQQHIPDFEGSAITRGA